MAGELPSKKIAQKLKPCPRPLFQGYFDFKGGGRMSEKSLLNGKKILIVDDEPDVLETLQELLSMCEIETASTFEQAKELIETHDYNFAILDIMGVDGYRLLEFTTSRGITTVMLTAHALSPDNVVKSFQQGAASYIPKDEMVNIVTYLEDIVEAEKQGKNPWWRWYDRLAGFFEKKFGMEWQENNKEFWEKFRYHI
jgi:CheY-like chemotaxis protein